MANKRFTFAMALGLIAGLAGGFSAQPANAALIQVGTRAAVGADLTVNWGIFGPAGTNLSCFCQQSAGPIDVHVNGSSGELNRLDEGTDYTGNFAAGDKLLSQPFLSDIMTVGFSAPILGFGTQIQPLDYTGAFTAYITVLLNDGPNQTFTVTGNSTLAEDNSAPFFGVTSSLADITGIQFLVDTGNINFPKEGALAINQLDVDVPVPEPLTFSLVGAGLAGLVLARRRKKVAQA